MDRFPADLPVLFSVSLLDSVAVVTFLLQLVAMASGTIGILPTLHHPPPHQPQSYEHPVRWSKSSHGHHHRRPVDVMTDVINDLGVKILDRYIEHNGNVAFSPSGLGFVLVALYEGSAGSSGRQIGQLLGLPHDRRITRIGLRDIHRRLRSYLNADAFLGGLTLNRDDINLRSEYEDVLRFYGFDIADSGNATIVNTTVNTTVSVTVTSGTLAASTMGNATVGTTMQISTQTSTANPTTIDDTVEIITNIAGNQNSALTMGSTSTASTANVATSVNAMSQPAAAINVAPTSVTTSTTTTVITNIPPVPSSTTPMSSSTVASNTSATTMASMMIMSIVQAIMNTMNGSATSSPLQNLVGPPTVAADMQTQSSDSSTVSLGASPSDSVAATSPMTTVVTMPMAAMTSDSMMQRLMNISMETAADSQSSSSDASITAVSGNIASTTPMTPATNSNTTSTTSATNTTTNSMTAATTNSTTVATTNSMTAATMNSMAAATTNSMTAATTNSMAAATTNTTNASTNSVTEAMTNATTDSATNGTASPTTNLTRAAIMNSTTDPATTLPTMMTMMSTIMTTLTDMTTSDLDSANGTTMDSSATTQMSNTVTPTAGDMMTNTVRKRRSVLQGPSGYFSSSADDGVWLDVFGGLNNNDDYQTQDDDIMDNPNPSTQLDFLVHGCDYSRVTAATYTAALPFAYFHSLRAALLEFPLDDPRYKILVMLPNEANGTRRLARILATSSITIRQLRRSLQPTWVTAVIPSFMLRGFVTLTPYLQRLGIMDVFEPRTADLSPMSPDLGVYARDIQQSIGVNIRNNMRGGIGGADGGNGNQQPPMANLARATRGVVGLPPFFTTGGAISPRSLGSIHYSPYPGGEGPIPFVVDRPFLYFIVDDQTSVSLLAGRIDDPLNSRIML